MSTGDLHLIKQGLQDRVVDVCEKLLPNGRRDGKHFVAHDPVQGDFDKTPALKILITGNRGGWSSFRGGAEHARHDILGLVEYILRTDTKGALAWGRDFLGLRSMSRQEREAMLQAAKAVQIKRQREDQNERANRIKRADELYRKNTVEISELKSSAISHALAYFRSREIPLEDVPNLARLTFRFGAQTEYWRGAQWHTENGVRRKIAPGPMFPAIHSAMRTQHGIVTACHITFLDPLIAAKAPVDPAKLMFGEAAGTVIELALGPSNKPFWQTETSHPLILCEGIETGFSFASEAPEARIWAAGSITAMGNAPIHVDAVSEIILARDNNHGNPTAQKQLDQVLEKLEAAGKPLTVINSHLGDDFNDLMKGSD